ncbi:MAG TPA: HEAT repeat domain-containing protein [Geothrix sp.]|nr:HEAT repeat domain-containing protein [Geothrix sp.]
MASFYEFFMTFQRALKALQLYTPGHPRHQESITALHHAYGQFLQDRNQVQIATRNGRLFVDRQMEDIDNLQIRAMARAFEERSIYAMTLFPGASPQELTALLSALNMKPAALRAAGGAKKLLEDQGVTQIRILAARLEDVSEAGEVAAALLESVGGLPGTSGAGGDSLGRIQLAPWPSPTIPGRPGSPGNGSGSDPGFGPGRGSGAQPGTRILAGVPQPGRNTSQDMGTVVGQVQAFLSSLHGGSHAPMDISGFGGFLEGMGLDRQGNQPNTQGVIMKAVSSLENAPMLGVLQGAADLRPGPLRALFGRLSSTIAAPGLATAFSQGAMSPQQLMETADRLRTLAPSPQTFVKQLEEALRQQGMSEKELGELVDILTWESRPTEERVKALLQGQRIFEMPVDKVLAFLRELLEAGRNTEFLRLMRHYATGLVVPAVARRLAVAQAFEKIADWVDMPGMPTGILDELMDLLTRGYGREKDPEVHQWFSKALEHIIWFWVESSEPQRACAIFEGLQDVVTELSLPAAWKEQATEDLRGRLGSPERVDKLLSLLFHLDRPAAAAQIHPILRILGTSAANHLTERLSQETDRSRRSRLLEALKACGQTAELPLLESLKSSEWFVVRNALIVLGEVAGPERVSDLLPYLNHADLRVETAAVRTIARLGGREAESALGHLLTTRTDAALLLEVLFLLGELKSRNSIPAILALIKTSKGRTRPGHDKVREKAVEVLGHLGSPAAIPELALLLHRQKGFFRDTKEPLPIRILALHALQAIGTPEALAEITRLLEAEPAGPEWDALHEATTQHRPATGLDSK